MKIVKIVAIILLILLLCVIGYLGFMTITDYKPATSIPLSQEENIEETLNVNTETVATTFNIGYCGLDKERDFFMDGGTGSRSASLEKTEENLDNVITFLQEVNPDFILLQEVDREATRSFRVDQYKAIKGDLDTYNSVFAVNYKVPWVPVPLNKPHGQVESGIATFSKYTMMEPTRRALPGKEKWPRQLALLDRCFIDTRIPVENGKELVLINAHLSAYDKGGIIRKQQLDYLKTFIWDAYSEGNYVVVGGDWNHLMPGTNPDQFETVQSWPDWLKEIPEDFLPEGFKFGADATVPTNRSNDAPYVYGQNYLSVIDGFLVSPNVEIHKVIGHDLQFEYSDHNPVSLVFSLKGE